MELQAINLMTMKQYPLVGIDSHCHLSFLAEESANALVKENPGFTWLQGGYNFKDWKRQLALQNRFGKKVIKTAFGIHPWVVKEESIANLEELWSQLLTMQKECDFVGETGLDFFGSSKDLKKDLQIEIFRKHLEHFADKPFILHVVRAHNEVLRILDEFPGRRGLVHGFNGSLQLFEEYKKRNFLVSIGPSILNTNNKKLEDFNQSRKESG